MATINTITGQLARINSSAKTIWNAASNMALKLPAGSYWDLTSSKDQAIYGINTITGTDSPAAVYTINSSGATATYNFGIDAVAAALAAINTRAFLETDSSNSYLSGDQSLNAGDVVKIPVGYNKTAFTITVNSLGSQLNNTTAAAKHLYTGKTAYIKNAAGNPEIITGTLANVYLYGSTDGPNANKVNGNFLKVSINNAATDEYLNTNIYYRVPEAVVTESTSVAKISSETSDNKSYVKVNLAKGYYDKDIVTDIAYISGIQRKEVKVQRYFNPDGTSTNIANTLTIPAGYYKDGLVITPVFEDREHQDGEPLESILNILDLDLSGGPTLTFDSNNIKVFNPVHYNGVDSYDYFGEVIIPKAGLTSENGQVTVTGSGWVNKDEVFGIKYGILTSNQINVSDDWDSTNKVITDKVFTIKVDQGYYSSTNVTKEFTVKTGNHTLTTTFHDDAKFGGSATIDSNNITTISHQFEKVSDSTTAGWIAASSSTTYYKVQSWVRKGATAKTNDYYTIGTPGWISAGTDPRADYNGFKYVGNALNSGGTYNPVNNSQNLTIPAGTVLTNDLTVNPITVGQATYKILAGDLADGDSIITITSSKDTDGQEETYMSQVTIDMTLILQELQKI